jgi:hypothetical protein
MEDVVNVENGICTWGLPEIGVRNCIAMVAGSHKVTVIVQEFKVNKN